MLPGGFSVDACFRFEFGETQLFLIEDVEQFRHVLLQSWIVYIDSAVLMICSGSV